MTSGWRTHARRIRTVLLRRRRGRIVPTVDFSSAYSWECTDQVQWRCCLQYYWAALPAAIDHFPIFHTVFWYLLLFHFSLSYSRNLFSWPVAIDVTHDMVCLSVCVGHTGKLCKNGWTNRDAIWGGGHLCEPKESYTTWGSRSPATGRCTFEGTYWPIVAYLRMSAFCFVHLPPLANVPAHRT